jgi:hypothetical protein
LSVLLLLSDITVVVNLLEEHGTRLRDPPSDLVRGGFERGISGPYIRRLFNPLLPMNRFTRGRLVIMSERLVTLLILSQSSDVWISYKTY